MPQLFNRVCKEIIIALEADFSQITTHDFKGKANVKNLQNDYILQRIPQRNSSEIVVGFVGNAEGLQSHIEEYQQLGFNNLNQIIIFEQQTAAANALLKKAIELGYKTSSSNENANELKIYNDVLDLDLKNNTPLQDIISHITHIDYDGTSAPGSHERVVNNIYKCFSYPNVKSMVNVHTAPRTSGGLVTPATQEINKIVDDILKEPFEYASILGEIQEGTLSQFFQRAALNKANLSTSQSIFYGILKDRLKTYIGLRKLNTRPVLASYKYLADAIAEQKDLSSKVIPYFGRSNMYSAIVVRDSNNTSEIDTSLQSKTNESTPERLIKSIIKNGILQFITHKETNQRLGVFLKNYVDQLG